MITLEEMETIIRIGRTDDRAVISTTDTMYMTKLDKLVRESDEWECTGEQTDHCKVIEKSYTCPKKFISFRSKKITRELTEEQRRVASERAKALRTKKS